MLQGRGSLWHEPRKKTPDSHKQVCERPQTVTRMFVHAGMLGPGLPPYVSQYGGSQTRTRLVCIEFCPPLFPEDDCDQSMQSVRRSSLYDTPWGRWTPCRTSESEAPSLLWLRHPPAIAALIRGPGANDWPCWRNIILCRLTDDVLSLVYFHVHTTTCPLGATH